jgi:hypothetical protein
MFRWTVLFSPFVLFVPIFAQTPLRAQDAGDVAFDTRSDAAFGDATVPLQEFLRAQHVRSHRVQHFCVAGYQSASGDVQRAWIHWTEGRKIILWRGASNSQSAKTSIARSRVITDLKKDVVPTEADIKGSTYLVTQAWVDRLIADCQARGAKYEVGSK